MAQDAVSLLVSDHRKVDALFKQVAAGGGDQSALVDEIVRELSIHDAIEKQLLYPALRQRVDGGDAMADRSLGEHQKVEELLAELEKTGFSGPDALTILRETMGNVADHVAEEESQIFPALQGSMSVTELQELGDKLEAAKKKAPTHPHPMSPNSGIGAKVGGAAAGLMDKAKDAMSGRRADEAG